MAARHTIGIACYYDASDISQQSGYAFGMREALIDRGHRIVDLSPLQGLPRVRHVIDVMRHRSRLESYNLQRRREDVAAYGREIDERLRTESVDFILAPTAIPVADITAAVPVVVSNDQPFPSTLATYSLRPSERMVREGWDLERRAHERADLLAYSSRWATETAQALFPEAADKIVTIEWGGNPVDPPSDDEVDALIDRRIADPVLRLLFVGGRWYRKGGVNVLGTFLELRRRGVDVELTVVGNEPYGLDHPGITNIRRLDKRVPAERRRFVDVFRRATVYLGPSVSEAFGMAFVEAAAFAVPSVSQAVGGVEAIVLDGVTGRLLPASASPHDLADAVMALRHDDDGYRAMGRKARERTDTLLNWDVWAGRLEEHVATLT